MPTSQLPLPRLTLAALALGAPALAAAQTYPATPPLAPMSPAEVRQLPQDMRSAPAPVRAPLQYGETREVIGGVETVTRTRRIDSPAPAPQGYVQGYAQTYPQVAYPHGYAATGYAAGAPMVFERQQWIDECRRRTRGRNRNDTGLIIGGLLGAIAGGFIGNEIAATGDKVLGTVVGAGGGGLIGGLIGSLFDGPRRRNLYNCEAALDSYIGAYGAPGRIASREIAYPGYGYGTYAEPGYAYGYGYPQGYGYSYGYGYAAPPQVVWIPVRTEVQQQVVVRETERYESYTVPGAERMIPAPAATPAPSAKLVRQPAPKLIKQR